MWLIPVISILLFVSVYLLFRRAGGGSFPWIQFYVKGKESGFNFHEINLLRKVAVDSHLEKPLTLFWSVNQLDRCVKGLFIKFQIENHDNNQETADLLAKLFLFRKRIEFDQPKYRTGLSTTRKLSPNQIIRVSLTGRPLYAAKVVENLRKYLAISYPRGPKQPLGFSWRGQKINVYFRRKEDAEYTFQTKVLDDFSEKKVPILYIAHSDSLIRSQKRKSVRAVVNSWGQLFPLKTIESASDDKETLPGLRCRIVDISEDGAAILIGGRAKVGLPVKIQFYIADDVIIMRGVIKNITYSEKKNQSILHIQAVSLRSDIKNRILSYVYNIFQEQDAKGGTVLSV